MGPEAVRKIRWSYNIERRGDILLEGMYELGFRKKYFDLLKAPDFSTEHHLMCSTTEIYDDGDERRRNIKKMRSYGEKLPAFAKQFTSEFMMVAEKFLALTKKLEKRDFKSISLSKVQQSWQEFLEAFCRLIPYCRVISEYLEEVVQDIVVKELQGQVKNSSQTYTLLTSPKKMNTLMKENINRLKIAALMKANPKQGRDEIKKHIKTFGWLSCYHLMDEPMKEADITKEIQKIVSPHVEEDIANLQKSKKKNAAEAKKMLGQLKLSDTVRQLLGIMSENAWVRTYRKEVMFKGNCRVLGMTKRIAREMALPLQDLKYIHAEEISEFLAHGKKVKKEMISARKKKYVQVKMGDECAVFIGDEADLVNPARQVDKSIIEVKGMSTFPGKVTGEVQVMGLNDNNSSFQRGKILVCSNVSTVMTPLVEKCLAIVANEGGVLSHTAVVSREFSKPCIVGTKIATKVFRTGDFIEVDASNNVARKVTKQRR